MKNLDEALQNVLSAKIQIQTSIDQLESWQTVGLEEADNNLRIAKEHLYRAQDEERGKARQKGDDWKDEFCRERFGITRRQALSELQCVSCKNWIVNIMKAYRESARRHQDWEDYLSTSLCPKCFENLGLSEEKVSHYEQMSLAGDSIIDEDNNRR